MAARKAQLSSPAKKDFCHVMEKNEKIRRNKEEFIRK